MKYIFDFYRNIVLTSIDAKGLRYESVKKTLLLRTMILMTMSTMMLMVSMMKMIIVRC